MSILPRHMLARLASGLRAQSSRFRRDEGGAIVLMVAGSIVSIILVIGGAIDVYRYEMLRKRAQNTLDRAVLAAAALDQKIADGGSVVRSYMSSAGLALPDDTRMVECPKAGPAMCCPLEAADMQLRCLTTWASYKSSFRAMSVDARYEMDMAFLWLAGQDRWTVPVQASAIERERRIEISLVLDLSSSMVSKIGGTGPRRIDRLKPAAANFVDLVLGSEAQRRLTSVSLIPYTAHTSAGREMFDHLAGSGYRRKHDYSSCFHFEDGDYDEGLPDFHRLEQTAHYSTGESHRSNGSPDGGNNGWIWTTTTGSRGYWRVDTGHNRAARVDGVWDVDQAPFRCSPDAHVYYRGNWNDFALVDADGDAIAPDSVQPLPSAVTGLPAGRDVKLWTSNVFHQAVRCAELDSEYDLTCRGDGTPDGRSYRQAMLDGDMVYVDDPASITYFHNDPAYLRSRIEAMPVRNGTGTDMAIKWGHLLLDPAFRPSWRSAMQGGVLSRTGETATRPSDFADRPTDWNTEGSFKFLIVMTDGRIDGQQELEDDNRATLYDPTFTDGGNNMARYVRDRTSIDGSRQRFADVCEAARRNNVEVFTIGFDMTGKDAETVQALEDLRDCASSASHYFDVDDGDIDAAFRSISAAVQRVRLTS